MYHKNRVIQIRRGTDLEELYLYLVRTEVNCADVGTRPDKVVRPGRRSYLSNSLWWPKGNLKLQDSLAVWVQSGWIDLYGSLELLAL